MLTRQITASQARLRIEVLVKEAKHLNLNINVENIITSIEEKLIEDEPDFESSYEDSYENSYDEDEDSN